MPSKTITLAGEFNIARIGYGAMRLTGQPGNWGPYKDPEGAKKLLLRAVELGVQFIDTADAYGPGENESLIAACLHPYPANLLLTTKGGAVKSGPSMVRANGRPNYLRAACEQSLMRLKMTCLPLYQFHRVDPEVPFAESIGAMADLVRAGKIRHIGISNVTLEQVKEARTITPIATVQNRYSVVDRQSDGIVDHCEKEGIVFLPYGPLGAGPFDPESPLSKPTGPLGAMAEKKGVTPAQIAIAWLLHRSPSILPIPGTTSMVHLEENVAAASVSLTPEEIWSLGVSNAPS